MRVHVCSHTDIQTHKHRCLSLAEKAWFSNHHSQVYVFKFPTHKTSAGQAGKLLFKSVDQAGSWKNFGGREGFSLPWHNVICYFQISKKSRERRCWKTTTKKSSKGSTNLDGVRNIYERICPAVWFHPGKTEATVTPGSSREEASRVGVWGGSMTCGIWRTGQQCVPRTKASAMDSRACCLALDWIPGDTAGAGPTGGGARPFHPTGCRWKMPEHWEQSSHNHMLCSRSAMVGLSNLTPTSLCLSCLGNMFAKQAQCQGLYNPQDRRLGFWKEACFW